MLTAPRAHHRLLGVWGKAPVLLVLLALLAGLAALGPDWSADWRLGALAQQEQRPTRREFRVVASDYRFTPDRLVVSQGDIVKIRFRAEDMAHSFAIDDYRIAKRAGAGQSIEFEFRANRAGQFPFYCNLALEERCSEMHGELIVAAR